VHHAEVRVGLSSGVRVFFDVEGAAFVPEGPVLRERPTLVLIHGAEVDHAFFKPWVSPLADIAQLVYVDLPSHGRSDRGDPSRWNLDSWAADIHEFVQIIGVDRPIVLGSSMGARVAMTLASTYPLDLIGLIVVSSAAVASQDRRLDMFEKLGASEAREAARRDTEQPSEETKREFFRLCMPLMVQVPYSDDELARLTPCAPDVLERLVHLGRSNEDLRPILDDIRCPVLVMTGDSDPAATPGDAADTVAAVRNAPATLAVIPSAGHGVYRDNPASFLHATRAFIQALSRT
jgi:pimeloyl-ACP methyl ester carboxylesterase